MYTKHKWENDRYFNFNYVKYLPKDYDKNKKYPLVFFLHGAGEWGDDLDVACRHGFMKHVRENGKEYPFIFIAEKSSDIKYDIAKFAFIIKIAPRATLFIKHPHILNVAKIDVMFSGKFSGSKSIV